jgi:23S rRNA pseudouridine1911/1915/1917 synthase
MKSLRTNATEPARLDRIVQQLTGLSRAGVRGLLDHGCVTVNGSTASQPQLSVASGDGVEVHYDPHRRYKERLAVEPDPAYRILFEDEHLIVVDKAAHVLTVPTASGKGKTLIEALQRYINRGKPAKLWKRLHIVHRLDQGVSGVMVVAKSGAIAQRLKDQFATHKPQRIYIAIVNGVMEQQKGTFRSHLATDYSLNRYSTRREGHGELAITHYEVLEGARPLRRGAPSRVRPPVKPHRPADFTIVRVQLETGRRNQIRVHFAEAGHPVLGDPRYPRALKDSDQAGEMTSSHPRWRAKRLALHAASLELEHPATGKTMCFEAELPREFAAFMA